MGDRLDPVWVFEFVKVGHRRGAGPCSWPSCWTSGAAGWWLGHGDPPEDWDGPPSAEHGAV